MSNELNTNSMMTNVSYTLDQIKQMAPSVFTTDKAPHLTDKYIQTPTSRVVEDLIESLQTKIQEIIAKLPNLVQKINLFKSTELTETQMQDFATKAMQLRTKQRVNIMDVLTADRPQDAGNDLWVVFNRIQEKLIGGSYRAGTRKARSVKNFQKDIELNEQLFELAESYL